VDDSGCGKRSNAAFKAGRSTIERKELSQYILSFKTGNGGSSRNARFVQEAPVAHNKARSPLRRVRFSLGDPGTHTRAHAHIRAGTRRESAWIEHFRVVRLMNHLRWLQALPPSPILRLSSLHLRASRCRFPLAIRLLALERLSGVLEFAIRSDLIDTSRPAFDNARPDRRTHLRARLRLFVLSIKSAVVICKAPCLCEMQIPREDTHRIATGERENFTRALCDQADFTSDASLDLNEHQIFALLDDTYR